MSRNVLQLRAIARRGEEPKSERSAFLMAPEPTVLEPADIALYLGKRGSGKSTRAKALAERMRRARRRVLVMDPHDEWSIHGRESDQVRLGTMRQRFEAWELLQDPSLLEREDLAAAVVPAEADPESWARVFESVLRQALEVGDCAIFLEEMATWGMYCAKALDAAALNSRHARCPLVAIGQRANRISLTFRSQSTHINSGLQTDPTDLDALAEVAGQQFADDVSRLGRGQWCHWRDAPPEASGSRPQPRRKRT